MYDVLNGDKFFLAGKRDRFFMGMPFGVALYERTKDDIYFHRGVVENEEDAKKWLQGEEPKLLVTVYPEKG